MTVDRRFAAFWTGQTISQFGDRISELALPLIAVQALHASAQQVAWLTALIWLPYVGAIGVGTWVDRRRDQQRLLVLAELGRAAVLLSLPVAYALGGGVGLGQLYVVAVTAGAGAVLFSSCYPSFFTRLVPRSAYLEANSRLSTSRSVSFVAGPAIGGLLVQVLSAPVAVAGDALSFLGSALLIGKIRVDETPPLPTERSRVRDGLTVIVRDRVLRAALAASTTLNFFTFLSTGGLTVLFARTELGLSAGVIGLAFGAGSIGAVVGAVLAPRLSRRIGVGRSVVVGAVVFPAAIAVLAAAGGPFWLRATVVGASEFVSGLGVMLFDVNLNSLQTSVIRDGMRGRVAGAFSTVNYGVRPVAAVLGGVLAALVGVRVTFLVAAIGGTSAALWLRASPIPRIRSLADG